MYNEVTTALTGVNGVVTGLVDSVQDQFLAILPVAIPVVGGIAIAFFGIRVVRGLLHV
jgi:hypothetical protein